MFINIFFFQNHPHFSGLNGAITFFKFMEHQDHILGIFKRVQTDILRKLQQVDCLPVYNETGESALEWAMPSTIIMSKQSNNSSERSVITSQMLKDFLNLTYIHPEFTRKEVPVSEEVLQALGVSQLSLAQLVEVLKRHISQASQHDSELFTWIGQWMNVVSKMLQEQCDFSEATKEMLQSLKMVPDNKNELVSLAEKVVFFPVVQKESLLRRNKSDSMFFIHMHLV